MYARPPSTIWTPAAGEVGPGDPGPCALMSRLNRGNMEGGVNSHQPGKLESDCCLTDDSNDGEWTHEPQGHLPGLHPEGQPLRGQPYALPHPVPRGRGPVPVGRSLVLTPALKRLARARPLINLQWWT